MSLYVGCGLGGAAFLIAQAFGARVHGIDLSRNMLQLAQARCQEAQLTQAITFEHADVLHYQRSAGFDLVHSRDVFLHIHDKAGLFDAIRRCLRPGGLLLFSDYLCRTGAKSADFETYIRSRGYDLRSIEAYHLLLDQAGFEVLLAQDRTAGFIEILERELEQLQASQLDTASAPRWRRAGARSPRARAGEQRWGVCIARKPI